MEYSYSLKCLFHFALPKWKVQTTIDKYLNSHWFFVCFSLTLLLLFLGLRRIEKLKILDIFRKKSHFSVFSFHALTNIFFFFTEFRVDLEGSHWRCRKSCKRERRPQMPNVKETRVGGVNCKAKAQTRSKVQRLQQNLR